LPHQDRLNIAVFIDFDNIEIGVKSTLNEHFDVGIVLDGIKERGEVVTKIAYADWTRAGEYSRHLTQHAFRLVQRNLTPGGDKNGADINLALDALEMVFTHEHINAYVIVGGDSDFLSLVEKLKQYDKKVFVVGGRAFTSIILQRNCHEFIAYENLIRSRRPAARGDRPAAATATTPISQAFPIVRRGLKILADREVSPQTGLLKSTLLQLDSTFSERNYGASSFLDFAEKLAKAGLVQLKHAGRSVMVELNEGFAGSDGDAGDVTVEPAPASPRPVELPGARTGPQPPATGPQPAAAGPQLGSNADGLRLAGEILRNATSARWPMYVRNVKQLLRQYRGDGTGEGNGDGDAAGVGGHGFDERQYGFGGLMDLLKACQREGLLRVERDRRGGLRVFPGQALQRQQAPPMEVAGEVVLPEPVQTEAVGEMGDPLDAHPTEEVEAGQPAVEPIDTTAELLGRAKPRRPRARAAAGTRGTRKTAVRKPSTRRSARTRKSTQAEASEEAE
jgi:uncharacterized LabA/DUF88 family protein